MSRPAVDRIAEAVLYEGYILYPYRPSLKNRQRWTFGGLYPEAYCHTRADGSASSCQAECLIEGGDATTFEASVRFLHLTSRQAAELNAPCDEWPAEGEPPSRPVDQLRAGERLYQTWQEAEERKVSLGPIPLGSLREGLRSTPFSFPGCRRLEPVRDGDGKIVGLLIREQQTLEGVIEVAAAQVANRLFKVALRVVNLTGLDGRVGLDRDAAVLRSMVSTHAVLRARHGRFLSLVDPPESAREAAAGCENHGLWPVLVGEEGQADTMLASPIILYDYPEVAPESPGDFFDGTEIDEMLTLRILTLTDEEKRAMAAVDERAGDLLARTENMAREQLLTLHGTMRDSGMRSQDLDPPTWGADFERRRVECIHIGAAEVREGDRVRLRPRGGADIMDLALAGKTATIETIEQDLEGRLYLAVTVDDDPGRDLGLLRQPGHRFFFQPEEVEPLVETPP